MDLSDLHKLSEKFHSLTRQFNTSKLHNMQTLPDSFAVQKKCILDSIERMEKYLQYMQTDYKEYFESAHKYLEELTEATTGDNEGVFQTPSEYRAYVESERRLQEIKDGRVELQAGKQRRKQAKKIKKRQMTAEQEARRLKLLHEYRECWSEFINEYLEDWKHLYDANVEYLSTYIELTADEKIEIPKDTDLETLEVIYPSVEEKLNRLIESITDARVDRLICLVGVYLQENPKSEIHKNCHFFDCNECEGDCWCQCYYTDTGRTSCGMKYVIAMDTLDLPEGFEITSEEWQKVDRMYGSFEGW